jgi:hypothetical protein
MSGQGRLKIEGGDVVALEQQRCPKGSRQA